MPAVQDSRDDERETLALAYDAAVAAVAQQDVTLGNLRNRATAILSSVAIASTFAGALGLFSADKAKGHQLPTWAAWALLVIVLVIGFLSVAVLWPVNNMVFGVDAGKAVERLDNGEDAPATRRYLIAELLAGHAANASILVKKFQWYRWAIVGLAVEVSVFIFALTV